MDPKPTKPRSLAPLQPSASSSPSPAPATPTEKKKKSKKKVAPAQDVPSGLQGYAPAAGSPQALAIAAALAARKREQEEAAQQQQREAANRANKPQATPNTQTTTNRITTPIAPPTPTPATNTAGPGAKYATTDVPAADAKPAKKKKSQQNSFGLSEFEPPTPTTTKDSHTRAVTVTVTSDDDVSGPAPASPSSATDHRIRVRGEERLSMQRTITGRLVNDDYIVSFYPRMKHTAHLENYFVVEVFLQLMCGCFQQKRDRQLSLLCMHKFIDYLSPILGLLWCGSMGLSLLFFTNSLPEQYIWTLLFSGLYPLVRVCFASVPILRLLLSSFESWFLLAQVGLLITSFGALVDWDFKFIFAVFCLCPGLMQMILLDANMTSIWFSTFAMLFGASYMLAFMVLLGTGRIVDRDIFIEFEYYRISLIDFTTTRLLTLILFMLKNIISLIMNPKSYIQIRSRVYKHAIAPSRELERRVSIA